MATRSDIEARVAHYTSRDDIDFSVVIPQALAALDRRLRLNDQLEILQVTEFAANPDAADHRYYDLPADFNTVAFIDSAGLNDPPDFLPPDQFFSSAPSRNTRHRDYTVFGKRLYLTGQSGDDAEPLTFTLGYFRTLEDLPNANSTNALTDSNSDVLVAACEVEVYILDQDEEQEDKAKARLDEKIATLNKVELRKRYDYRNLRTRNRGRRQIV